MELSLAQLIVYLVIAVVAAFLAGALVRTSSPYGFLSAFIAALFGEWLIINVFHIFVAPEISYQGVPVITALIGAVIVVAIWALITGGRHHRRYT